MYNHLRLWTVVFSIPYMSFYGISHVSTLAQNGETKHWQRGPFFFCHVQVKATIYRFLYAGAKWRGILWLQSAASPWEARCL